MGNRDNTVDLLKMLFAEEQLNKTPGRVPTAHVQNEMLGQRELTRDQQGEEDTINAMDARTDASFNQDLAQNKAQAGARNEGYDSLRNKEDFLFQRDKNAKMDIARAGADTALSRMFMGSQLIAGRQDALRDRIDAGSEATRNGVAQRQQADDIRTDALKRATAMETGKVPDQNVHIWNKMLGWTGAVDNEQEIRYRDAEKIRDQARTVQPGAPIGPGAPDAPEPPQAPTAWVSSKGAKVRQVQ